VKREDIEQSYRDVPPKNSRNVAIVNETEMTYNSYRSQRKDRMSQGSRNRSFCQFLSQQEAYQSEGLFQ
jgi:hypothetical protein